MMSLLAVVFVIFCIVVTAELLWRQKVIRTEQSRKLVHIGVGVFASTWGFFLTQNQIILLAGLLFVVVLFSRIFNIFGSIHKVSRRTLGELFFPLGIALTALLAGSSWVFMAAMLHVGVADGLAALMGVNYVDKHGYKVFGQQKTVVGSVVFAIASLAIVVMTMLASPELTANVVVLLAVPLLSTFAENVALFGSDDVVVPVVVALVMNLFI